MKVESYEKKDGILQVMLCAEAEEFREARRRAYLEHTDRYPVPGCAGGLASLTDLEKVYGPAVLYDEALELAVPELFGNLLKEKKIRIMGKPRMEHLTFTPEGGARFRVRAELYPQIRTGEYRGVKVPLRRQADEEAFVAAAVGIASSQIEGEIPKHMVEQKLDAMLAQEKLRASGDAIYHVLADTIVILKTAYREAGAERPVRQVREEAMDLMLQTVSGDNQEVSRDFFCGQIRHLTKRYHSLPEDYDKILDQIIEKRKKDKAAMKAETVTEEVFRAYLGSLGLNEEAWRKEREGEAVKEVCRDLLLDKVAEEQQLAVTGQELEDEIRKIAAQCGVQEEQVLEQIDTEPIKWHLLREKAKTWIADHAVEKAAG